MPKKVKGRKQMVLKKYDFFTLVKYYMKKKRKCTYVSHDDKLLRCESCEECERNGRIFFFSYFFRSRNTPSYAHPLVL